MGGRGRTQGSQVRSLCKSRLGIPAGEGHRSWGPVRIYMKKCTPLLLGPAQALHLPDTPSMQICINGPSDMEPGPQRLW
jgi:hypothetical protein